MIVEMFAVRLRIRRCVCGFMCDDNFTPDDEPPDRWIDHLEVHPNARYVFRWRGAFDAQLRRSSAGPGAS